MTAEEAMAFCKGYLPECDTKQFVLDILAKQKDTKLTTNLDYIRSLPAEELARILLKSRACDTCCAFRWEDGGFNRCSSLGCKRGITEWLNSEYKEEQ